MLKEQEISEARENRGSECHGNPPGRLPVLGITLEWRRLKIVPGLAFKTDNGFAGLPWQMKELRWELGAKPKLRHCNL